MAGLSLCMIVKNEEEILEKSITSIASVVDEIIIVDTGSTDSTVEIAKTFTDKVFHFPWINDFAAAYNEARSYATQTYAARWDADFVLQPESLEKLHKLKERNFDEKDILYFRWNTVYGDDGTPIKYIPREFIYRKDVLHWVSPVHAHPVPVNKDIIPSGQTYDDIVVDHYKDFYAKKKRYSQTLQLISDHLSRNPYDQRGLFLYAEDLIHAAEYARAITVLKRFLELSDQEEKNMIAVEKILYCYLQLRQVHEASVLANQYKPAFLKYPRFRLIYADILILTSPKEAKKHYLQFLALKDELRKSSFSYDSERYEIYPYLMLGITALQEKDNTTAYTYLNHVYQNSSLKINRLKAFKLLAEHKFSINN